MFESTLSDDITNDNLNFLVVFQYERNFIRLINCTKLNNFMFNDTITSKSFSFLKFFYIQSEDVASQNIVNYPFVYKI